LNSNPARRAGRRSLHRRFGMQQIGDAAFEPFQVERLDEKILGMDCHGALVTWLESALMKLREFFGGRLAAQNLANGQTVEVRQQDVEQDQIRFELPRLAQRLHPVAGHDEFTNPARRGDIAPARRNRVHHPQSKCAVSFGTTYPAPVPGSTTVRLSRVTKRTNSNERIRVAL